jgi:hypothetical protein
MQTKSDAYPAYPSLDGYKLREQGLDHRSPPFFQAESLRCPMSRFETGCDMTMGNQSCYTLYGDASWSPFMQQSQAGAQNHGDAGLYFRDQQMSSVMGELDLTNVLPKVFHSSSCEDTQQSLANAPGAERNIPSHGPHKRDSVQRNFRHVEVLNKQTCRMYMSQIFAPQFAPINDFEASNTQPNMGSSATTSNSFFAVPQEPQLCDNDILVGALDMHRTTITVRNVPWSYCQSTLLELWNEEGFDFLFLPMADQRAGNLGRIFLNFPKPELVIDFYRRWNGVKLRQPSKKPLKILFANIQGRDANIMHILNESHSFVEKPLHQPIIREQGLRVPFFEYIEKAGLSVKLDHGPDEQYSYEIGSQGFPL